MKKLILLGALLLAACINVDDFGIYANKAFMDPDMKGNWIQVFASSFEDKQNKGEECRVTKKQTAYQIQCTDHSKKHEKPDYPIKTLAVGPYKFIIDAVKSGGILTRYQIAGKTLTLYELKAVPAMDFIESNYPAARQIEIKTVFDSRDSAYININKFDDDVYAALSNLPDDKTYWKPTAKFEKISD